MRVSRGADDPRDASLRLGACGVGQLWPCRRCPPSDLASPRPPACLPPLPPKPSGCCAALWLCGVRPLSRARRLPAPPTNRSRAAAAAAAALWLPTCRVPLLNAVYRVCARPVHARGSTHPAPYARCPCCCCCDALGRNRLFEGRHVALVAACGRSACHTPMAPNCDARLPAACWPAGSVASAWNPILLDKRCSTVGRLGVFAASCFLLPTPRLVPTPHAPGSSPLPGLVAVKNQNVTPPTPSACPPRAWVPSWRHPAWQPRWCFRGWEGGGACTQCVGAGHERVGRAGFGMGDLHVW